MEWVFASNNLHKLSEIRQLMPPSIKLQGLQDIGFTKDIPETGSTLEANAKIKAGTIFRFIGKPVFADDSGLFVNALNGAPGVFSARYAGESADSGANCNLLLKNMKSAQDRTAYFQTTLCLYISDSEIHFFSGRIEGQIAADARGTQGFGYDPIFIPRGMEKTFAELSPAEKNRISHRKLALQKMIEFIGKGE